MTLVPAVLPALRAGNGGYIVNISIVGLPFSGLYCATKFALEDMSESLRLETRPFGIHVVLVEPGDIRTQITAKRCAAEASQNSLYRTAFDKFRVSAVSSQATERRVSETSTPTTPVLPQDHRRAPPRFAPLSSAQRVQCFCGHIWTEVSCDTARATGNPTPLGVSSLSHACDFWLWRSPDLPGCT